MSIIDELKNNNQRGLKELSDSYGQEICLLAFRTQEAVDLINF